MNILLLNLKSPEPDLFKNPKVETLGLGYLASYTRKSGHNVSILDANILDEEVTCKHAVFKGKQFDVAGFSVLSNNLRSCLELSAEITLRFPGIHITFGGYYSTFHYKDLLQNHRAIDSIVRGEGEIAFSELLLNLSSGPDWRSTPGLAYRGPDGVIANPAPSPVDPGTLPFPARDTLPGLFQAGNRVITISSSRGCGKKCSFCSIRSFYGLARGKPYRERPARDVVEEIKSILNRDEVVENKVRYFWFCDDEFVGPEHNGRSHGERMALELIAAKIDIRYEIDCRADSVDEELFALLRRSGLRRVFLGIESFIDTELKYFKKQVSARKNLRALGILEKLRLDYSIGCILFTPGICLEDFIKNIEHLRQIGYWRVLQPFNRLKILTGSDLSRDNFQSDHSSPNSRQKPGLSDETGIYSYEFADERISSLWAAVSRYSQIHNAGMLTIQRRFQEGGLRGTAYWVTRNAFFEFTGDIIGYLAYGNRQGIGLNRQFAFLDEIGIKVLPILATFNTGPLYGAIEKINNVPGSPGEDEDDRFKASSIPGRVKNWRNWLVPLVPLPYIIHPIQEVWYDKR